MENMTLDFQLIDRFEYDPRIGEYIYNEKCNFDKIKQSTIRNSWRKKTNKYKTNKRK